MQTLDEAGLIETLSKYKWYHRIKVADNLYTTSVENAGQGHPDIWDLILNGMNRFQKDTQSSYANASPDQYWNASHTIHDRLS